VRLLALEASPNLYHIFEIAYWIEGPLLLWYTRALVYREHKWSKIDYLFLMPVVIFLVYMTFNFFLLDKGYKTELLLNNIVVEQSLLNQFLSGFTREALRVIFGVMCLIDIRHCRRQIRNRYSNVDQIDLGWLNFLVIAFLIIRIWAVFVSVALISSSHFGFNINFSIMGLIGNYTTFILVSGLIFFSLLSSSLFEGVESQEELVKLEEERAKTQIDLELAARIENHMKEKKPFLANILTLEQLAKQLEIPSRTLSHTINHHFKHNFFEFINHYRVEEAKAMLSDPQHRSKTMIEVMAESGFNSKATFNTFFKKLVGSTPSQYRNAQFSD